MFEWIKKHKVLLICLSIFVIIIVPVLIHILFKIQPKNSFFSAEWTAGDALGYYGSVLSFVGTVVLGALALYQNQIIKDESDRREQLLRFQEHERNMPKFLVKAKGSNGNCANLIISINNVSENNASNVKIYDAKILSPQNEQLWRLSELVTADIIKATDEIDVTLSNPSIQQDGSIYIIYMQCEDKYNEEHNYEISGVYYAKIPYPNFEIKEIEKQSKVL